MGDAMVCWSCTGKLVSNSWRRCFGTLPSFLLHLLLECVNVVYRYAVWGRQSILCG